MDESLDLEALREIVAAGTKVEWNAATVYPDGGDIGDEIFEIFAVVDGAPIKVATAETVDDLLLVVAAVNALPVLLEIAEQVDAAEEWSRSAHEDSKRFKAERDAALAEVGRLQAARDAGMGFMDRATKAEAEVARLTAVVQGVRELADECEREHWYDSADVADKIRSVLAGGTDTPKGEGDE